ncbi:MAG: single-stranded-DNA-specific exonuclease RecJ [Phototrophicales bacterium]|nr:MAG: single-stranded-DNA-specific exonuclease RecJ [Phototrophicales bacterium]
MLPKQWFVAPSVPPELLRQYKQIHPVLAQVLHNRGFTTPDAAYRFLYVKTTDTPPFKLKGMNKAVARIRQAIKAGEAIVVYGDFDADGVTSTALMVQVLKALNADVRPYIPHRVDEGYGLNSEALYTLAREGAKLVITVDCGIRSINEIEEGKVAGLDIIVTDHHSIGPELPDSYAVVNPKQSDCHYPEEMLAGVGVAYKLAEALLKVSREMDRIETGLAPSDILDLVAIGTVADLVPLNHIENRSLVRRGLVALNRAQRPGVRALLEVADIQPGQVTAASIGFGLGPRINAAGRLESAMLAYDLLSAPDMETALPLAHEMQALNARRQDITREMQAAIEAQLIDEEQDDVPLIFAAGEDYLPGVVGLVAGRLVEAFYRPAIVMELGEHESRASCRSIPQFDITNALDQCADLLVRHGGHAQAAGFTVRNENIDALRERLMDIARRTLDGQELVPTLNIDAEVDVHDLSEHLVDEIKQLEPTGFHNSAPVLMSRHLRVVEWRTVGEDNRHLKLKISRAGQPPIDAIGFGLGEWASVRPDYIDAAYYLEMNEWNGHRNLQLNLQDIRRTMA